LDLLLQRLGDFSNALSGGRKAEFLRFSHQSLAFSTFPAEPASA